MKYCRNTLTLCTVGYWRFFFCGADPLLLSTKLLIIIDYISLNNKQTRLSKIWNQINFFLIIKCTKYWINYSNFIPIWYFVSKCDEISWIFSQTMFINLRLFSENVVLRNWYWSCQRISRTDFWQVQILNLG